MLKIIRTDAADSDFQELISLLDQELRIRDGAEHGFYAQFNKSDTIRFVVLAYLDETAVGCGAFKEFDGNRIEIKRMYVRENRRGRGVAGRILEELEKWAVEEGFGAAVLETGRKQPEAIGLYRKCGYEPIPNYGQYAGVENSVCLQKNLTGKKKDG
jgi:putative acetyltransferase